jgi:uncharacterized protein (TIGR02118 family)
MFNVLVMYPAEGKFDLDYYMKSHMPLVDARFRPHGLAGWSVLKVSSGGGAPATYQIVTRLEFETGGGFKAAIDASGPEVMGDIPNFTDTQPLLQMGNVVPA